MIRPQIIGITGTKTISEAALLGVVSGYVPYRDVAVSQQTGEARVVFTENSGLASVVPIDYVQEIIRKSDVLKAVEELRAKGSEK